VPGGPGPRSASAGTGHAAGDSGEDRSAVSDLMRWQWT